ncbi:unnamed protein product [Effrenium voratum]|nr:unnamed protein product [Effrenium voratum]
MADGPMSALQDLQHWQQQLEASVQALLEINQGINSAAHGVLSLVNSENGKTEEKRTTRVKSSKVDEDSEKFELSASGAPVMLKSAAKSRATEYSKKEEKKSAKTGLRLLEHWRERFVICEEDATAIYNQFYSARNMLVAKSQRRRTTIEHVKSFCSYNISGIYLLTMFWNCLTIFLVSMDLIFVPASLGWPEVLGGTLSTYYQVTPGLWLMDIVMSIVFLRLRGSGREDYFQFFRRKMPLDLALVVVDIVLLVSENGDVALLRALRLLRTAKFRSMLASMESQVAARGNISFIYWSTILQCVAVILLANHCLACTIFYVGRLGKRLDMPNWLDTYLVLDLSHPFQYMMSFNLVLAEYTPAPYPYRAQNELEQILILVIILSCLPLLGAQIGKISGTLNSMKEKAKEREHVKRDLQRWLRKTSVPAQLNARMVMALDDVLNSAESPLDVKDPLALNFLPSTLVQELRVVKTGQKLSRHSFFSLLMDERLAVSGQLTSAFRTFIAVLGEQIFHSGRKAEGLFVTINGRWTLQATDLPTTNSGRYGHSEEDGRISLYEMQEDGLELREDSWVGELALYTDLTHSASLSSKTYAKAFSASANDFAQAVKESPAVVVAIHEYAVSILRQQRAVSEEVCWELLPSEAVQEATSLTQISELLMPGTSRMHALKNTQAVDFSMLMEKVHSVQSVPELLDAIVRCIVELQEESGLYSQLQHQDEAKRAQLSVLSAIWLLQDSYEQITSLQSPEQRLTRSTWSAIRELINPKGMSSQELIAVLVLLGLRGLSKNSDFAKLCPPSERRSPEKVLEYAIEGLECYMPSIASLDTEALDHVTATVRMLGDFNFAQFLQGENNPHSVWMLQSSIEAEGTNVYKMFLLTHVCILCGVTGAMKRDDALYGSLFLNELNGRTVLRALRCLQDIVGQEPQDVFWHYIGSRAEALDMPVQQPAHLVLARLACLTRTLEPQRLQVIQESWAQLADREREALYEIFLLDGHMHKAFIFLYLPLFLTNCTGNEDLGLKCGLQFLVELHHKLIDHRCLNQTGPTVKVDISSLASLAEDVEDLRTLRKCLEYARIVKAGNNITVLLTTESYQILTGQLVDQNRQADLLELLAQQQLRVEALLRGQTRGSLMVPTLTKEPEDDDQVISSSTF